MSFEDNKDNVESVYGKMIGNLSPELMDDRYYQYFMNVLETSNNYCKCYSSRMVKTVDENWISAIEEALPHLQKVVYNPRKYIEEERDIVNIAMAKNAPPESIQHLMQHSNFIDTIQEDGTVIPNKILAIFKEESLNTYENRFIATLILELQRFINKRFDVIFDTSKDERGTYFEMESLIDNYNEVIDYKLEIKIREKQTDIDNEQENIAEFTRISKIHREINDLAASGFMTVMRKLPLVKHPIVKTNAIGKNLDYKACHKLWNYIHSYDRVGYKVELAKKEPVISREFEKDIYNSFIWDYIMLRSYVEKLSEVNLDRPMRTKEMTTKYIRQLLDEIICGLDMPDSEIKKLIMNEVTNLLVKHKTEAMYDEVVARKTGKRVPKKKKKR